MVLRHIAGKDRGSSIYCKRGRRINEGKKGGRKGGGGLSRALLYVRKKLFLYCCEFSFLRIRLVL